MSIDRERILQTAQKYVDKRKYDRAVQEYQKIVQEDPNDARTLLKIGDLQSRMQAYPEAIATYDRVGQFYAAKGFSLKAIAVYKQIRELIRKHAPQLTDRYGHIVPKLAEIYTQLGLTSDALAAYDEVATRLQKAGRDRDAIDVFRKMVELDSTNPLPHLRLAEACCRVQSVDEAIDSFWTAGDMLMKMNRPDDALKVIERILHFRQDPNFARVAADLYLRRGDRENGLQALAKLQIAFQADPKDLDTLGLLAHAFTCIGQEQKSLEVYKEMARLARDQKRTDLYTQLLEHLRSVAPDDDQVRALETLRPPASAHSDSTLSVDDDVEFVEDIEVIPDRASSPPDRVSSLPKRISSLPAPRPPMTSAPDVVVVDDEIEVAEELAGPDSFDASAHARKAVVDAESFRKLRLFSKAIEALHIALEIDPHSVDIRHKLREVLVEAGERESAIQETINIAIIHVDRAEPHLAEPLLYEVLEVEPEHVDALQLLDEIAGDDDTVNRHMGGEDDGGEPLPSYDLEGVGAEQAISSHGRDSFDSIDDALLTAADAPFGVDAPLPSFPMGHETDEPLDEIDEIDELEPEIEPEPAEAEAPSSARESAHGEVEDVLEEADFYTSRGLWDDAKAVLEEQLERTPRHPLLRERLAEVNEALAAQAKSRTVERSRLRGRRGGPTSDRAFDIAASLDALDELDPQESEVPPSVAPEGDVDVDQVFEKFKQGVRAQVSEGDSATHYDLGVAYKEMGLFADACTEFDLAARDPHRQCMCFGMIGMIQLEQGNAEEAITAFEEALNADLKTPDQEQSLLYDLGNAYEQQGEVKRALRNFRMLERQNPNYRDVKQRVRQLRAAHSAPPSQSRAVNGEDEFDAVFDDLFEGK